MWGKAIKWSSGCVFVAWGGGQVVVSLQLDPDPKRYTNTHICLNTTLPLWASVMALVSEHTQLQQLFPLFSWCVCRMPTLCSLLYTMTRCTSNWLVSQSSVVVWVSESTFNSVLLLCPHLIYLSVGDLFRTCSAVTVGLCSQIFHITACAVLSKWVLICFKTCLQLLPIYKCTYT